MQLRKFTAGHIIFFNVLYRGEGEFLFDATDNCLQDGNRTFSFLLLKRQHDTENVVKGNNLSKGKLDFI